MRAEAQTSEQTVDLDIAPPASWEGGWKPGFEDKGPDWRAWMFVPANAEAGSLKRMINILFVSGPKHGGNEGLIKKWSDHLRATCPGMSTLASPATRGSGYTVVYARFDCQKRSDTGEGSVDIVKTMSSENGAYMVSVAQRTAPYTSPKPGSIVYAAPADAEALRKWLGETEAYLKTVVRTCSAQSQTPRIVVCSN